MPGCTGGEKRGRDSATMQVRKRKKNQIEEEEINLHGSASTQSLKAGGAGPLPPRETAVAVDGAPSERPKEQNKGNIFSTDGNRPY